MDFKRHSDLNYPYSQLSQGMSGGVCGKRGVFGNLSGGVGGMCKRMENKEQFNIKTKMKSE